MEESDRLPRKLAAILYADVAGYSRLTGADEDATHRRLREYLDCISTSIERHQGKVTHYAGDAVLAMFEAVVDALNAAVEIQKDLQSRNESFVDDRKVRFRIGINLGDVIEDRGDIYGDGVNVAARLESLAVPGGICISEAVRDAIGTKLRFDYEFLGEQHVKNIAHPVAVYKVLLQAKLPDESTLEKGSVVKRRRTWWAASITVGILLGVIGGIFWMRPWGAPPVALPKQATPPEPGALALQEELSIAVLPFDNVGGEKEQDYFADGMTDDLITDLSKISGLFVSTRASVIVYRGKALQLREVAEELGVRYLLQGSVRKSGDKVRVNAQLIDAATERHLWTERYDGSLADVFALQDEVSEQIVAALAVNLTPGERAVRGQKINKNPAAYDAFLRGWSLYRRATPKDFAQAVPYLKRAVAEDPEYGRAYATLAALYRATWSWGWHRDLSISKTEAFDLAKQNLQPALKYPTTLAYQVESTILSAEARHDEAIAAAERAIALDVNDAGANFAMASALIHAGRSMEGQDYVYKAMELDPQYPSEYVFWLGMALFGVEQFDDAALSLERAWRLAPRDIGTLVVLTATYGHLGRNAEAKATLERLNGLTEQAGYRNGLRDIDLWPFKEPKDRERIREGLRKAGVAELPDVARG